MCYVSVVGPDAWAVKQGGCYNWITHMLEAQFTRDWHRLCLLKWQELWITTGYRLYFFGILLKTFLALHS